MGGTDFILFGTVIPRTLIFICSSTESHPFPARTGHSSDEAEPTVTVGLSANRLPGLGPPLSLRPISPGAVLHCVDVPPKAAALTAV